jgi:hypothetical protein
MDTWTFEKVSARTCGLLRGEQLQGPEVPVTQSSSPQCPADSIDHEQSHDEKSHSDRRELASGANPAYLGDFYRAVAVRYLFMAEDVSKRTEKQGSTNPEVPPDGRGIAQDFDFLSQLAGTRLHSEQ